MRDRERPPLQLLFGAEKLTDVWFFPHGTMIWPERGGRGVVQEGLYAIKSKEKIRKLSGFWMLNDCTLYLNGKYWTLPKGSLFGAYAKNGKKVKLKRSEMV